MKIEKHEYYCTVGELLEFIEKYNIPRDGKILIQRVEDCYFNGCDISGMTGTREDGTVGPLPEGSKATPWSTIKMPGYSYYSGFELNEKLKKDKKLNSKYKIMSDEQLETLKDEYIVVWSPVKHDDDNLYLDAHY